MQKALTRTTSSLLFKKSITHVYAIPQAPFLVASSRSFSTSICFAKFQHATERTLHAERQQMIQKREENQQPTLKRKKPKASVESLRFYTPLRVRTLAEQIGIAPKELLPFCPLGYTLDDVLCMATMENILAELNVLPERIEYPGVDLKPFSGKDDINKCPKRFAVATVMGHVDHGKTTLLDKLRNTNVAAKEFGGITQHIGAFEVKLQTGDQVTFIDTPGHEAFSQMRKAGAQVTDIIILVVACDDGVLPQTIEAIKHAQNANVAIVVALNKIDKYNASIDKTTLQLMQHGLIPEDKGGDIPFVPISALNGDHLDDLIENIVLQAEGRNLCAEQKCNAEATVIEARIDKGVGLAVTAIVKRGVLRPGKWVVAGSSYGKIKALRNYKQEPIDKALPSFPVEIIGLETLPLVGDVVIEVEDQVTAKRIADTRAAKKKIAHEDQVAANFERETVELEHKKQQMLKDKPVDQFYADSDSGKQVEKQQEQQIVEELKKDNRKVLTVLLKADVQGTLDAFNEIVQKFPTDEVYIELVSASVGNVTEADIDYAKGFKAQIVVMNGKTSPKVAQYAKGHQVVLNQFRVIYHLIDHLKKELSALLPPIIEDEIVGEARVKQMFEYNIKDKGMTKVAGCEVVKGSILAQADFFRVTRNNKEIHSKLKILSLNHFKDRVKEVKKGMECGIVLDGYDDITQDDVIVCVQKKVTQRNFDELIAKAAEQKKKAELKKRSR